MKKLLLTLSLPLCAWGALAGSAKVTTLVSRPGPLGTNATLEIPAGQAAKVFMLSAGEGEVNILKGGVSFSAGNREAVVEGPATIQVTLGFGSLGSMATIEQWRMPRTVPLVVRGESAKVQTIICYASTPNTNAVLEIPAGQAARVVSALSSPPDRGAVGIVKDGVVATAASNSALVGVPVVEGPATILLYSPSQGARMATIERWRVPRVVPLLNVK